MVLSGADFRGVNFHKVGVEKTYIPLFYTLTSAAFCDIIQSEVLVFVFLNKTGKRLLLKTEKPQRGLSTVNGEQFANPVIFRC